MSNNKFNPFEGLEEDLYTSPTVKESVKRGYGPTCADNFGLPYNHSEVN